MKKDTRFVRSGYLSLFQLEFTPAEIPAKQALVYEHVAKWNANTCEAGISL